MIHVHYHSYSNSMMIVDMIKKKDIGIEDQEMDIGVYITYQCLIQVYFVLQILMCVVLIKM